MLNRLVIITRVSRGAKKRDTGALRTFNAPLNKSNEFFG